MLKLSDLLKTLCWLSLLLGCLAAFPLRAAQPAEAYRSRLLSPQVMSLQVYKSGDWSQAPVIELGSDEQVLISFDEMSHDYRRLAYRIRHCDAFWQASTINELDYLEGFSENDVPEGEISQTTTIEYTHYELLLPNDQLQLKLAGNYVLEVFDRDADEDDVLLQACFSLLDRNIGVEAQVSAQTDRSYNDRYQQLTLELQTPAGLINRPETELKVLVCQNRRPDRTVLVDRPYAVSGTSIRYEHHPALLFEGGNEYRRFDLSSYKLPGMGIDRLTFERPYYHAYLFEDQVRTSGYTYSPDENGRMLIRHREAGDADYVKVHFSLPVAVPYKDAVYLSGDLLQADIKAAEPLVYNAQTLAYETCLLLKQGIYNYLYSLLSIEGSFWPTGNEYQIFVYYRPFAGDYDSLIGYQTVSAQ